MAVNKESVIISCTSCNTNFRLWIPTEVLPEWGESSEVNCIKCGKRYILKRGNEGLEASPYFEEPKERAAGAETAASSTSTGGGDTILFVEDDKLATAIAENILSNVDVNLITVKNGKDALEKLDNGKIDLIVTDLHLINPDDPESDFDGEELLQKIMAKGISLPAIITTGKDILDDLVLDTKWFDLNVKGFIQKGNPFWAEDLRDKIKEVLKKD